jgi:hypothetical protein
MIGLTPGKTRKVAAVTSAAFALLAGGASVVATPAGAAGPSVLGCPYGAVCVYPQGTGYNGGHPEAGGVYFSYGAHDLHNQFGRHAIVNNQYNGAGFRLCTAYGGGGTCTVGISKHTYDLGPIYSIVLTRGCVPPNRCPK